MKKLHKTVGIIGLGYVGLPLALLAEKKGYDVIGIVAHQKKVEMLQKRISPLRDAEIEKELPKSQMIVSTDYKILSTCEVIILCVPTPIYRNNKPDLSILKDVSKHLAKVIHPGQLIILESTVNPGVSEEIVIPLLEKGSKLSSKDIFFYAHCPERINPGDIEWPLSRIPRVVGSNSNEGVTRAKAFYESILDADVRKMASVKEAEAVKIVENAFRDINIAFVNELAMSFSVLGIDTVEVIKGAATKPFSFLPHYPGCGVGGHCIPVDPYYLIEYANSNGFQHDFLKLARKINNKMPFFTVQRLLDALKERKITVKGARVAVLGVAYKANIDDTRESPALTIIEEIKKKQMKVNIFDPFVPSQSTVSSREEVLQGVSAIVIATDHDMFRSLSPKEIKKYGISIVIDGRNCLQKELFVKLGITYKGIGR